MHPLTLTSLMTEHKLIGGLIIFVALVFLVSITKIAIGLYRMRKLKRMQHGGDARG
jgi:hypothetical protein